MHIKCVLRLYPEALNSKSYKHLDTDDRQNICGRFLMGEAVSKWNYRFAYLNNLSKFMQYLMFKFVMQHLVKLYLQWWCLPSILNLRQMQLRSHHFRSDFCYDCTLHGRPCEINVFWSEEMNAFLICVSCKTIKNKCSQ